MAAECVDWRVLDDDTWRIIGGHAKVHVFWLRRACRAFYYRVFKDDELSVSMRYVRTLVDGTREADDNPLFSSNRTRLWARLRDETMRVPLRDFYDAFEALADPMLRETTYAKERATYKSTWPVTPLLERRAVPVRWCVRTDCDGSQLSDDDLVEAMRFFHAFNALEPRARMWASSTPGHPSSCDPLVHQYTWVLHRAAAEGLMKVLGFLYTVLQEPHIYEPPDVDAFDVRTMGGNNAHTWAQRSLDLQLEEAAGDERKQLALKAKYHPVFAFFDSLGVKNRPWRTEHVDDEHHEYDYDDDQYQ